MNNFPKDELPEKLNTLNLILGKGGGLTSEIKDLNQKLDKFIVATDKSREKTERANVINQFLAAIVAITAVISLWNIKITNDMKNEAIRSNQITQQPFLDLIGDGGTPVRYSNKGKGVAINIFMIKWDNKNKKIYLTKEAMVAGSLMVDKEVTFDIKEMEEVGLEKIMTKAPFGFSTIQQYINKDITWLAVFYEDLYGNKFATFSRGIGEEYTKAVDFISFEQN